MTISTAKSYAFLSLNALAVMVALFVTAALAAGDNFQTAVRENDIANIERLLSTASDVDARGTNGKTALMIAAKTGNYKLVEQLLSLGAVKWTP